MHPFAVIEGIPAAPMPSTLIRSCRRGVVLCLCSTVGVDRVLPGEPAGVSDSLPTSTEYCRASAEYIGKRMAGRNAVYAGDELNPTQRFRNRERVFGLLYLNGARGKVEPEGERARDGLRGGFAEYGVSFAVQVGYLYDPGRNQNDVTNVIAQFKAAGVTTIVPLVDPLYPILITPEATRQNYFPEWFIMGTGLSDTTTAGRLYDQLQWRHAFGISPLWITWIDHRPRRAATASTTTAAPVRRTATRACSSTSTGPGSRPCSAASTWRGRTSTYETFRQGLFAYPATPEGGGRPRSRTCTTRPSHRRTSRTSSRCTTTPPRAVPTSAATTVPG